MVNGRRELTLAHVSLVAITVWRGDTRAWTELGSSCSILLEEGKTFFPHHGGPDRAIGVNSTDGSRVDLALDHFYNEKHEVLNSGTVNEMSDTYEYETTLHVKLFLLEQPEWFRALNHSGET